MGVVFGDATSTQFDAMVATVVVDANGVIVSCKIDAIQNKFSANLDDEEYSFTNLKTKKELGYDYHMAAWGTSLVGNATVKEWFEQAAAFEAWVVGKTVEEVENMALQTMSNGYVIADEDDLLAAGCTISIEDMRDAVVKACRDEQSMTFTTTEAFELGLAVISEDNGSSATEDGATIKMNIDVVAVVYGVDTLASVNDALQPQITIDEDGEFVEVSVGKGTGVLKTKRELKEDYKMSAFGTSLVGNATVKEWYIQSAEFSKYVVGKTLTEIENLPLQTMPNGYVISDDEDLLAAGCTMQITGMQAALVKAIADAE